VTRNPASVIDRLDAAALTTKCPRWNGLLFAYRLLFPDPVRSVAERMDCCNPLLMWISGASAAIQFAPAVAGALPTVGVGCRLPLRAGGARAGVADRIRANAGYVGIILWGALIFAPRRSSSVESKLTRRLCGTTARRESFLLRGWLHPFDGWWQSPQLYHALTFVERGEEERAAELLRPLEKGTNTVSLTARLQARRLERRLGRACSPKSNRCAGSKHARAVEPGAARDVLAGAGRVGPMRFDGASLTRQVLPRLLD